MDNSPTICWFRLDLRLDDNPALNAAIARGGAVIPVFIWAPEEEYPWPPGAASRWWLHHSLAKLDAELRNRGSKLILLRGPTAATLRLLAKETGANRVFWNRRFEPMLARRDEKVHRDLSDHGITPEPFLDSVLFDPEKLLNRSGKPFQVFTPFWKACLSSSEPSTPVAAKSQLSAPSTWPDSLQLAELKLLPKIDWAGGMRETWQPGYAGADSILRHFCDSAITNYCEGRDQPDRVGTSRLSPHLHFGEISPRRVWHFIKQTHNGRRGGELSIAAESFLCQLGWREFAHYLLHHFPHTAQEPLRSEFSRFDWNQNTDALRRWQTGQTGYPYIDAGMRELWSIGWMHNRVRMAVASFLVKDLRISWLEGAKWFWDTLVDADLANNTLGWQWTAGCGADAAPYFRVFNPVTQAEKFDPDRLYVRRWVPELSKLPNRWIHQPWNAPNEVLASAGIRLGETYPQQMVDHDTARKEALAAFRALRQQD